MDDPSQLFNKKESENNTAIDVANTELASTQTPFKGKTITRPILIENAGTITKLDRPESQGSNTVERNSEKQSSQGLTINPNDETAS